MGEFVVSGCDAPPLLELVEDAFDAPSLHVGDLIEAVLVFAMAAGRDDWLAALFVDEVVQAVSVVGAISKHLLCMQAPDQPARRSHVVLLTRSKLEAHWKAERIDYGVDLGPEPAPGSTESLGLNAPLFIRAPAAWA